MSERISIVISRISSTEDLAQEWRRVDKGNGSSFFTAWPWIGTWLALLPSSVTPYLLRLEHDGRCRGVAVAVWRNIRRYGIGSIRRLHINETGDPQFDCVTIEHNGFAGRESNDPAAWRALIDWFGSGAAEADELSIPGVTHDIADAYRSESLLLNTNENTAYRINLASLRATGGSVGSILSANARQQLNRSMRSLSAWGPVNLKTAKDADEALAFFDALKRLHVRSWSRRGQPHGFTYPFVECFHRRLIERCIPSGEVELLRLSAGSRELGYLYNFYRNGVVYSYQSGFDDEDRSLRPGYVAHALAIERSAASGALTYDFMAGPNRLKETFATDHYAMRWYTLQRPLLRFKAERAARCLKHMLTQARRMS